MKDPIAGYGRAVSGLKSSSGGRYAGPEVTEAKLRSAYDSVDGLDTGELRVGARVAAGETQTAGMQQWLIPVIKFIGSLGAGMVASELVEKAQDWFTNRDEAEEVADAAGRAADAIDVTVDESDQGTAAILAQLTEIIAQISAHLATIDPTEHPDAFASIVQAGADIINEAATMILGVCADRDKAIEECYCALIEHGKQVCEKPDPELACDVSGAVSAGGASTAVAGASGGSGGGVSAGSSTPAPTTPASVEVTEDREPAPKVKEKICEPETVAETCPTVKQEPEPVVDCEPADDEQQDSQLHTTLIGALGVGIVVAGVGEMVHFLEEAFHDAKVEVEPVPAPEEPAAVCPPEPEPEPLPAPEPAPEPVNDKTPESELHLVPEPPAKPIPAGIQAAYVSSPEPASVPPPPAPEPPTASAPPQPEPLGEPESWVRKAGGW